MPLPTTYATGTVSVVEGDTTVTFTGALLGTAEAPNLQAGDQLALPDQPLVPAQRIASVDYDAGTGELWVGWPGESATDAAYEVRLTDELTRSTAQSRLYLELLGQLQALGIQPDAYGTLAGRDTYDLRAPPFIYLSIDAPWTLYAKQSATDGDWDAGQAVEGIEGPPGPAGLIGAWEGPWLTGTAYVVGDAVSQGGSSYICIEAHTSGTFATDLAASKWEIVAAKGDPGDDGDPGTNGTNGVDGKFSGTETVKTSAYTAAAADVGKTIILNKATADTLSFQPAATLGSSWMAIVKNIGAGTWTLDPDGAETIDGAATVSLATNQSLVVASNGTALRTLFLSSASAGVLSKTANYTVVAADKGALILCDASSAAFTVTLPAAATAGAGFEVAVKKTDTSINTVTVDGDGSETIDGATTFPLDEQYEEVTIRSDGAGWAVVTYHAPRARNSREVLTANRTYYVRTDGNNSNSGLADTSGGAFLTPAKALSVALSLDLNGFDCILKLADGTYTSALTMASAQVGAGRIILRGNTTTPANVVISTTGNAMSANAPGARLFFEGVKLTSSAGSCIFVSNGAIIKALGGFEFGSAAVYHTRSLVDALADFESVNHAITGAALRAYSAEEGGKVKLYNCAVTLSGTLGFTTFAHAEIMGIIQAGLASFTGGTITGKRYDVYTNAVVNAGGGGTSLFPGSTAGTVDSNGGRYVA